MRATYRLQLGPGQGFAEARALVPYLHALGVSHLYLSPVLRARRGSTHGYDVADPTRVSEELGGEAALRDLCGAGLEVLLDIVPNHMAVGDETPLWADPARRRRIFDIDPETGRHRRFFDIDDLAGVRVEDPEVFEETHALVLRLVREGLVEGLRVDHVDGLADPRGYLRRLADAGARRVWVEKITEGDEDLPDWPVEGTTGYDLMNDATGLFVDPAGARAMFDLHRELSGDPRPFAEVAAAAKLEMARGSLAPEVERLRRLLDEPRMDEAVAALPVYRTYVEPWADRVDPRDRAVIEAAPLPERVRRALLLEEPRHDAFVTRFQQTTGAVMAKGVEDTAFYRYTGVLALCEVGGDPGRPGRAPAEVHAANLRRLARFPRALLATQTHDTKRSPDVRARLAALTGFAEEWCEVVVRWGREHARLRERGDAPTPSEENVIYQTLVGAWPLSGERLRLYMTKAMREAKLTSGWAAPDEAHERAVLGFCDALLADRRFVHELEAVVARAAEDGERWALGQVLLKLAAPGVPDLYQGDELWDFSLVDPDNRRPVDWDLRRATLDDIRGGAPPNAQNVKLFMIQRALDLRARRPRAFDGDYLPIDAGGRGFALARGGEVIAATPIRPGGEDDAVAVPADLRGRWRSALTGAEVTLGAEAPMAALLGGMPVGLLERAGGD